MTGRTQISQESSDPAFELDMDPAIIGADAQREAAAVVAAADSAATKFRTPCGAGHMVWRRWGEGPPVLLVHGGAGAWSHWIRNIGPLSERYTVWVPDTPAMGDSDTPEPLTLDNIRATVWQGLDMLISDGLLDVVGFSFGGPIAAGVAVHLGSRLRNLVLAASRYVVGYKRFYPRLVVWKDISDPLRRLAAHRRNLELMMMARRQNIDALAVYIQSTNAARARYFGPKLNPSNKLIDWLPKVRARQRVTGICGREDQGAAGIIDRQEAALRLIHPTGRFHAIDAAGHWVQYEAADRFNEILLRTLAEDLSEDSAQA